MCEYESQKKRGERAGGGERERKKNSRFLGDGLYLCDFSESPKAGLVLFCFLRTSAFPCHGH